ncbi:dienelactone hydrolase family protein [Candidatus Chlorohelix sp.]|uniref:dienelactone hydrolase family protein n=1 Tax=Candidatus Chlorohelix sp. TaxID=3139201 RepID=UPI00305D3A0D
MSTSQNYVDVAFLRYRTGHKETNAFLAVPNFPGPLPGIIIAHDIFGLDDHIKDVAIRFAKLGYSVLVPDFYSNKSGMGARGHNGPGPTTTYEQRRDIRRKTADLIAVSDITRGFEYFTREGYADASRIAIVGFGFGGTIATLAAGQTSNFAAAVNFYGDLIYPKYLISRVKPESPINYVPFIQAPYLAFYGAPEEDISLQDVRALENELRSRNKIYQLKSYPRVPNGFFNDNRPTVYNEAAAKEAFEITTTFLSRNLKSVSAVLPKVRVTSGSRI